MEIPNSVPKLRVVCDRADILSCTRGTCSSGISLVLTNVDMFSIVNELVNYYGEDAVIEWITEKKITKG